MLVRDSLEGSNKLEVAVLDASSDVAAVMAAVSHVDMETWAFSSVEKAESGYKVCFEAVDMTIKRKPGRPLNPDRKLQIKTWVMLFPRWRRKLNANFGSFQAGVEELVRRYCEPSVEGGAELWCPCCGYKTLAESPKGVTCQTCGADAQELSYL